MYCIVLYCIILSSFGVRAFRHPFLTQVASSLTSCDTWSARSVSADSTSSQGKIAMAKRFGHTWGSEPGQPALFIDHRECTYIYIYTCIYWQIPSKSRGWLLDPFRQDWLLHLLQTRNTRSVALDRGFLRIHRQIFRLKLRHWQGAWSTSEGKDKNWHPVGIFPHHCWWCMMILPLCLGKKQFEETWMASWYDIIHTIIGGNTSCYIIYTQYCYIISYISYTHLVLHCWWHGGTAWFPLILSISPTAVKLQKQPSLDSGKIIYCIYIYMYVYIYMYIYIYLYIYISIHRTIH